MSTDTLESRDQPAATPASGRASTLLWLIGGVLAAVLLGLAAGHVPSRLRLFFLFPIVHGVILASLLQAWRGQVSDAPPPRWTPIWLAVLVAVSVVIGAVESARHWQSAGGRKLQPGAALARQMVEQMPAGTEPFDPDARRKLLDELSSAGDSRTFGSWLAARAGGIVRPWPEILWGSECLSAVLAAVLWNRRAAFHAAATPTRISGP